MEIIIIVYAALFGNKIILFDNCIPLTSVAINRPIENAAAHDKNVIVVRHFLSLNGCRDMIPLTTQCHIAICNEQEKRYK